MDASGRRVMVSNRWNRVLQVDFLKRESGDADEDTDAVL